MPIVLARSQRLARGYRRVCGATWLHVSVIVLSGALLRAPLLPLAPLFTTDSRCCYYHYAANQLLAGKPFDSGLHYPPGYAIFLAAVLAATDMNTVAVVLLQHALGLASGLLVYALGRRLFNPLVGLVAGLATVLDVELALYEHEIMTETLFTFLLLTGLWLLVSGLRRHVWATAAGFGVLAGVATLVRPTGLLLAVLVLLAPAAGPVGRRVHLTVVALIGSALVLLPVVVWNGMTHGVFTLTTSLQRNMLYRIEEAPDRLLRGRGTGDPLLGRIKATISHHPRSAWGGPYGRVLARFHLTNQELDALLIPVAIDFVLADPLAYAADTLRRLALLLTGGDATAAGLVQWSRNEYAAAGGPAKLGITRYDYHRDRVRAEAYDRRTRLLQYALYAWPLLALATFGAARRCRQAALPAAVLLYVTLVTVGTNNPSVRFRYPVLWALYLLAAAGTASLITATRPAVRLALAAWRGQAPPHSWGMVPAARGALPFGVAGLLAAGVLVGLARAQPQATTPPAKQPPLPDIPQDSVMQWGQVVAAVQNHLATIGPGPRMLAVQPTADLRIDMLSDRNDRPDGRDDDVFVITLGPEAKDERLAYATMQEASQQTWDTTGWDASLALIHLPSSTVIAATADPILPALAPGDQLLVLRAGRVGGKASGDAATSSGRRGGTSLTLHFRSGRQHLYRADAPGLYLTESSPGSITPETWLARYAAPDARVAIITGRGGRVAAAAASPHAVFRPIPLPSDDWTAIRKWLHAGTLRRHHIQYVWVGDSTALKGEAGFAVWDRTRLLPVLLQVPSGDCVPRWRGLFVVVGSRAAATAPVVPLTIPHPLAPSEFSAEVRFSDDPTVLTASSRATLSVQVTNQSAGRWYGTCSTHTVPVGVALEWRGQDGEWFLAGEALFQQDIEVGTTAMIPVEIAVPADRGTYELRARAVQRPDVVSPSAPAVVTVEVVEVTEYAARGAAD